jgi:hypothetical protein
MTTAPVAPSTPPCPPARTHAEALEQFRRPFAPGALGFRAMTKVAHNGNPYGGAQVAAYISAQSVLQRLNTVAPGRWRHEFRPLGDQLQPDCGAGDARGRLYLACRLTVTLPHTEGSPDTDAIYEDIGELDAGSLAGLKALYSDARKRAGVAAGIGAYLYTALAAVVLPIGPGPRQVQAIRRAGKSDLLAISPETQQWLRDGYRIRMNTPVVLRNLGPILAHGEPDDSAGQGESTELAAQPNGNGTPADPATAHVQPVEGAAARTNGDVVAIDFGSLGPAAPAA